jgi:PAS domain S-box-containing protein
VVERTAELRASEQRFQALVQHSSEVVILVGSDANVEYVSESMTRVFGYSEAHLLGRPLTQILDPDPGVRLREGLAEVSERPYGVLELELTLRHRDGHHCTVQFTITNLLDNPSVGGLVLNTRDISERRQLEDQLVHQAFHDSLTSLANRALFKDRVDHALQRTKRQTPSVAVLFLDLDGFKEGQRQPRPRRRGPAAHPGGRAPALLRAAERHRGPFRRRRVRRAHRGRQRRHRRGPGGRAGAGRPAPALRGQRA